MALQDSGTRTALVTGGNRGIGKAIARMLANAGYRVVATHSRETAFPTTLLGPGEVTQVGCDQRDPAQIDKLFCWLNEQTSSLDILVNNAGIAVRLSFREQQVEQWQNLTKTLIDGPLAIIEHSMKLLESAKRPALVHISSDVVDCPLPYLATYGACKAVMENQLLCRLNAFKSSGIALIIVAPGMVNTEMQANQPAAIQEELNSGISPLTAEDVSEAIERLVLDPNRLPDLQRLRLTNFSRIPCEPD